MSLLHARPCAICWNSSRGSNAKLCQRLLAHTCLPLAMPPTGVSCLPKTLHEIDTGDCSVDGARQRRARAGYVIPLTVKIDAMSVYASCAASYVNIPADIGMMSHAQYIRELLDTRVLTAVLGGH